MTNVLHHPREPFPTPCSLTHPMSTTAVSISRTHKRWHTTSLLLLAAWAGFNLRATVLGVPPLLDRIGGDLQLSHAAQGLLTSLPILCFGLAALPGARLARRLGGHRTVAIGLGLVTLGSLIRSAPLGPDAGVVFLFTGTLVLGVGIGIAQPAIPRVLRAWIPQRVQQASLVVTLGYIVGQVVAATIPLPLLAPHLGGWRQSLAFWALPSALALAWWLTRPSDPANAPGTQPGGLRILLRSRQFWTVATMLGCANLCFFTANTWIGASAPGGAEGAAAELDLFVVNISALPVALVLASLRRPFVRSRSFYLLGTVPVIIGGAGWLATPALGPLWVTLIGAGSAVTFSGTVAFPAILADETRIAPFSALLWTVACIAAFLGPVWGGIAIDLFGSPRAPFAAIALAGLVMGGAALLLPTGEK